MRVIQPTVGQEERGRKETEKLRRGGNMHSGQWCMEKEKREQKKEEKKKN